MHCIVNKGSGERSDVTFLGTMSEQWINTEIRLQGTYNLQGRLAASNDLATNAVLGTQLTDIIDTKGWGHAVQHIALCVHL